MPLPENLPNAPKENVALSVIRWMMEKGKSAVMWLFTETNPRPDILTDAFLREFRFQFDRMCAERKQGVHEHPEAGFFDHLTVESCETPYAMFTAVLNDYPVITNLRDREYSAVVAFLMKHCDLPGSSLL